MVKNGLVAQAYTGAVTAKRKSFSKTEPKSHERIEWRAGLFIRIVLYGVGFPLIVSALPGKKLLKVYETRSEVFDHLYELTRSQRVRLYEGILLALVLVILLLVADREGLELRDRGSRGKSNTARGEHQ